MLGLPDRDMQSWVSRSRKLRDDVVAIGQTLPPAFASLDQQLGATEARARRSASVIGSSYWAATDRYLPA